MKPGGMHFAAIRSEGICGGHGLAASAASLRIFDPEMEMKSSLRDGSLSRIVCVCLS